MFIGKFLERSYQDPTGELAKAKNDDGLVSNSLFDPNHASNQMHRYLDEHCYAEEMGFDAIMLNEHHNGPFCMGHEPNIEAAILARITERVKIVMLGNLLPIWDNPLLLAEQLAEIDLISRGRLVGGWVRGTGRESLATTSQPTYNWERLQEAHELIQKTWTVPGPFRWEGKHFHNREVNPWLLPYQKPVPAQMACGLLSKDTMEWAARRRYPYSMFATEINATKAAFEFYDQIALEEGYEAGSQHRGYLFKVHVDETDERAFETGKDFLRGASNPFNEGNEGRVKGFRQNPPGFLNRQRMLPTWGANDRGGPRLAAGTVVQPPDEAKDRRAARGSRSYEQLVEAKALVVGSPETVTKAIKEVIGFLNLGSIWLWFGDGSIQHETTMRQIRLLGQEVIPEIREYAREQGIKDPFEVDPGWNITSGQTKAQAEPAVAVKV